MQIYIFLFIFKSLPSGQLAAGPLPPTGQAVGVQICKMFNRKYISVKNIFLKCKNKKDADLLYTILCFEELCNDIYFELKVFAFIDF